MRYAAAEQRTLTHQGWTFTRFIVDTDEFSAAEVKGYSFWEAVAKSKSITIRAATSDVGGNHRDLIALDLDALKEFAPRGSTRTAGARMTRMLTPRNWTTSRVTSKPTRRADFLQLTKMPHFKMTPDTSGWLRPASSPQSFSDLIAETLKSQLACDLVHRGYIDRNFPIYAAQFYGRFTGLDVATFIVQHVQTNSMAIKITTLAALARLRTS